MLVMAGAKFRTIVFWVVNTTAWHKSRIVSHRAMMTMVKVVTSANMVTLVVPIVKSQTVMSDCCIAKGGQR